MKTKAEKWLRDNYTADWSPKPGNVCVEWLVLNCIVSNCGLLYIDATNQAEVPAPSVGQPKALVKPIKKPKTGLAAFSALVFAQQNDSEDEEDEVVDEPIMVSTTEVDFYLQLPALPTQRNGRDTDPLDWWSANYLSLPNLCKMARQFFAMPASSAGPERAFTAAGRMHDDYKKNLSEETLCMMLEVKFNL